MCTKHCTWLVLVAMVLTIALQGVPSLVHIPTGGVHCTTEWSGWPFGFRPSDPNCVADWAYFASFFLNGLLNVILFFLPLRWLHGKVLHRKPKNSL